MAASERYVATGTRQTKAHKVIIGFTLVTNGLKRCVRTLALPGCAEAKNKCNIRTVALSNPQETHNTLPSNAIPRIDSVSIYPIKSSYSCVTHVEYG